MEIKVKTSGLSMPQATIKIQRFNCMKGYKLLSINATAGFLLMLAFFIPQFVMAQAPTLGTYTNATVMAGQNTLVTPSIPPSGALRAFATASANFSGTLSMDPVSGNVRITAPKNAGTFVVTVKAYSAASSATTSFSLTVTNPVCSQGNFVPGPAFLTGSGSPTAVGVGDFNNDGHQDLVACNQTSNIVSVKLGSGTGVFSDMPDVPVAAGAIAIVVADLNGDGKQDLAVANGSSNTISIRFGDGTGAFTGTTNVVVNAQAWEPSAMAGADFDSDGDIDLAVTTWSYSRFLIFTNNGSGTFTAGSTFVNGTVVNFPRAIAVGDFNKDNKPDVVIANSNLYSAAVFFGDGAGWFSSTLSVPYQNGSNNGAWSVTVADFNKDSNPDFAVGRGDGGGNDVRVFFGNGLGAFSNPTIVPVGGSARSITAGDFNGDGNPDFITVNFLDNSHSVRLGDGQGAFTSLPEFSVGGSNLMSIGVGDFNTDGKQDFITTVSNYQNCAIRLGGANEIDVLGNSVSIADGSTSPLTTNHTDFGVVATNSSLARTYTISNMGSTALTVPTGGITLTGTDASMFVLSGITLPTTIAAGGIGTFVVTFTPTSQGAKTVTLNVANNDCDEAPYNFALRGGQVCDFSTCVGKTLTFNATNSGASYAWSFGDASTSTAQNPSHAYTAPGQYTVTFQLTDVNGCVTTNSQVVCVYDAPVVTNTSLNPLCNGATNGSIDVSVTGGAPGTTFTYVWSNGATTQDLSNVGAGTYTVTVTDGTTTCFSTLSVTLTEPVVLAAAATVGTNVLCFGATNGTATASATGGTNPYTYAWSNGQTVANATGLAAGAYTVTVTDANGCSTTASVTIAQPAAALSATETHTNVGCFGASTGAIDLTVTGGTTNYTYLWSNGATTQDLSGLAASTYGVTVTDANGCTTTASVTVTGPASALAVAPSNSGNVCQAGSNSNLLSNATGGTPGYTYLWTPGNLTTQNVNNVGAGTYNVTVTDANGCTATGSTTVGTFPGTPASFIISH
jgi:hypothetical protein